VAGEVNVRTNERIRRMISTPTIVHDVDGREVTLPPRFATARKRRWTRKAFDIEPHVKFVGASNIDVSMFAKICRHTVHIGHVIDQVSKAEKSRVEKLRNTNLAFWTQHDRDVWAWAIGELPQTASVTPNRNAPLTPKELRIRESIKTKRAREAQTIESIVHALRKT